MSATGLTTRPAMASTSESFAAQRAEALLQGRYSPGTDGDGHGHGPLMAESRDQGMALSRQCDLQASSSLVRIVTSLGRLRSASC